MLKPISKPTTMGNAVLFLSLIFATGIPGNGAKAEAPAYHSPFDVAYSPDGKLLAVSDRTAGSVAIIDVASAKVLREVSIQGEPAGLVWAAQGPEGLRRRPSRSGGRRNRRDRG